MQTDESPLDLAHAAHAVAACDGLVVDFDIAIALFLRNLAARNVPAVAAGEFPLARLGAEHPPPRPD